MLRVEIKGCIFRPIWLVTYSVFQSFCRPVFKMAAANAHHRCGAVNLRSKQSRFYLYLWVLHPLVACGSLILTYSKAWHEGINGTKDTMCVCVIRSY